jgi:hypothetical protein
LPGAAPVAGGPSEFTRVLGRVSPPPGAPPAASLPNANVGAPGVPTPGVPQPSVPASAAPVKQKSYLPLIIALNVVLIGAIVAVVYFVMKR